MSNENFQDDSEILPDFNEEAIKKASTPQHGKLGFYRWRVTNATKDISNPEKGAGGFLMCVLEHTALKQVSESQWAPVSKPTSKTWLLLPRTPSPGLLKKRGYSDAQILKLLGDPVQGIPGTFDPNGQSNFIFNKFRAWARAAYPGSFAPYPQIDKATGVWTSYDAAGNATTLGTGDEAATRASEIKRTLVAEIANFAGKLWVDPKLAVGVEYYSLYDFDRDQQGNPKGKYPNVTGFPRRGDVAPKNKEGKPISVINALDAAK